MTTSPLVIHDSRVLADTPDSDDIPEYAKRNWYGDDDFGKPDQVWVHGPIASLGQMTEIARQPDCTRGTRYYIWRFHSEFDAKNFVKMLDIFPELTYWRVGKNPQQCVPADLHPEEPLFA